MRAVIQKVTSAAVEVDGAVVSSIGPGLLCLVGLAKGDTQADMEALARRILRLRAFAKSEGPSAAAAAADDPAAPPSSPAPWAASVCDVGGEVLLVSQFTLHARTLKRTRPDFSRAMPPGDARGRWAEFVGMVRRDALAAGARGVSDGRFGEMMVVRISNDGPVTFILDTEGGAEGGGGSEAATASGATTGTGLAAGGGGGGASSGRRAGGAEEEQQQAR